MKKIIYLFLTLFFTASFSMYPEDIDTYKIEIGQFNKIRLLNNANVIYRCLPDSSGFAQFRGKKEFADAFILTLKNNGTLRIQVSDEDLGKTDLPVLYVYSDYLTSVQNDANMTLVVENPAPCPDFKATQVGNGSIIVENVAATKVSAILKTGNGSLTLSGNADNAYFDIVGTGMIGADRLKADNVTCKIFGTGSIGCWPVNNLSVKGIGSTKIYYKGKPAIKKSGGGKIIALPDDGDDGR